MANTYKLFNRQINSENSPVKGKYLSPNELYKTLDGYSFTFLNKTIINEIHLYDPKRREDISHYFIEVLLQDIYELKIINSSREHNFKFTNVGIWLLNEKAVLSNLFEQ